MIILHPLGSVQPLGVHIDRELNFIGRITTICRKTGRQLNVLGCLANVLSVDDKNILFECFILLHFNFCRAVYHCCSLVDIKSFSVQKRALRYIYNDYVYSYAEIREKVTNHYRMLTELS